MEELRDRVVLLTGASGGIGRATARSLVKAGAGVVLHDVGLDDPIVELGAELGGAATIATADLSDPTTVEPLWATALAWRGRIDVLVNNAGIYEPAAVDGALGDWLDSWHRTLHVNLVAPATLCRSAIKSFRGQPAGGIIINLASRAAFRGEDPDYWHYASSKAGIVAMTKTIARQYGRDGVTAFGVSPGFVNTPFNDALVDRYGLEFFARDTGLGEVAEPEDIAEIITFLASGRARHATGATIDVNGASYVR
jgi:NAD(P)-dependent dehydrogenase (short-subunit alcohol dehydrogenase family)